MPQIVFVTFLLALVAGVHPVEVRVGPDVKSVRMILGGVEVAALHEPPWVSVIDFGTKLEPAELDAIAYDANGNEIGRATQVIDMAQSLADVAVVVKGSTVELVGRHLTAAHPTSAVIKVDDKPLPVENFSARLPELDPKRPHIINAELRFDDGTVARREVVLTGGIAYSAGAELSPVLVTGKAKKLDGCFSLDGAPLRTAAIERPDGLVIMVRDPGETFAREIAGRLHLQAQSRIARDFLVRQTQLASDIELRTLWPVGKRFGTETEQPSTIFTASGEKDGAIVADALKVFVPNTDDLPRAFADAVAVAGMGTLEAPHRRAVVLVISDAPDNSIHTPQSVRKYLASIGVPLFVWSVYGARPDLVKEWGDVSDISRSDKLQTAIAKLRDTLAQQSIAWLPVDRLASLRVQVKPECSVKTVAKPETP